MYIYFCANVCDTREYMVYTSGTQVIVSKQKINWFHNLI